MTKMKYEGCGTRFTRRGYLVGTAKSATAAAILLDAGARAIAKPSVSPEEEAPMHEFRPFYLPK